MTNPSENSPSFDWARRLPWFVFFVAFGIRLIGITWGLPNADRFWSYHPDEPVNLFYARQINVGAGDFDPGFYNYGTLYLTLTSVADKAVSTYAPIGENPSREAIAAHDARVTLAARMINVLAGAWTAALAFLILVRWQGTLASTLGALLIALAPGHVVHSRFMTVDVLATFWIVASLYAVMRMLPGAGQDTADPDLQRWKWPVLAGVFAGLSAGTKYNGVLVLVALIVALAISRPDRAILKGLAGIVAAGFAFVISTPGCLSNPQRFRTDLAYELAHSRSGHGLVFEGMPSSFLVHVTNLVVGIGLIAVLLALAGLFYGAKSRSAPVLVALTFTVVFFILLGRAELAFLRYTFPLYVGLAIGLGWFVGEVQAFQKLAKSLTALAMVGLGGLPFGDALMASARYSTAMAGTDSRDAVIRYFRELPAKTPMMVGSVADPWFYSPPYFKDANAPRFIPASVRAELMVAGPFNSPARPILYVPSGEPKFDWDVRLLTETKPPYVAFSSFEVSDLDRLARQRGHRAEIQVQVDRYKAFVKELEATYEGAFFAGFPHGTVHDMEYVRPQIWVWKRKRKP